MPPQAANIGTESWMMAARVVLSPRKAEYQITYPTPEASAPESTANKIPVLES